MLTLCIGWSGHLHCARTNTLLLSFLCFTGHWFDAGYNQSRTVSKGDPRIYGGHGVGILDDRNRPDHTFRLHFQGYFLEVFADNTRLFVSVVPNTLVVSAAMYFPKFYKTQKLTPTLRQI